MVSDGAGGAIIVWQDKRSGNRDIYAHRVDAEHLFQLSAEASGTYALWTELGTLEDSVTYLYAPESQSALIAWNDDGGGTEPQRLASRLDQELTPGNYFIKVRAYRTNQSGTYTWCVEGP